MLKSSLSAVAFLYAVGTISLCVQAPDTARVRQVVEAVGQFTQAKNIAGLDTLFASDDWVRVIEGAGVNNGWVDYRDHHLRPELEEWARSPTDSSTSSRTYVVTSRGPRSAMS